MNFEHAFTFYENGLVLFISKPLEDENISSIQVVQFSYICPFLTGKFP
jgi:hypothetical protein